METDDDKFIAWVQKKIGIYLTDKDEDRLFALARRGAAAIADDKCKKDPRTFVSDAGSPFRADASSPFANIIPPPAASRRAVNEHD